MDDARSGAHRTSRGVAPVTQRKDEISLYRQRRIREAKRLADIIAAVGQASSIDGRSLVGSGRWRPFVDARWTVMRIARSEGLSLPQIGRALGGRDHTTILCGLRRSEALIASGSERGERIRSLEAAAGRILQGLEQPPAPPPSSPAPPPPSPAPASCPTPEDSPALACDRPRHRQHGSINRFGEIILHPWADSRGVFSNAR